VADKKYFILKQQKNPAMLILQVLWPPSFCVQRQVHAASLLEKASSTVVKYFE
jgi:hypothetical protein